MGDRGAIDWDEVKAVQKRIDRLWEQEEKFWGQRSRIKWLKWGDRNSRFFHASTIQRRDRNRIVRIKDSNGVWREGHDEVFTAIQSHFADVYHSEGENTECDIFNLLPKLVTPVMNASLKAIFSMEDIKDVVFSLGATKAPGPNGFNGMFYQRNWDVIKDDICLAICGFFEDGRLPLDINETLVTLVPKVHMPESINQLRPISCCNFVYKVISKLVVLRLESFLGKIIIENQSAFVGGRLIQDNLVVAQEVFHALKRKNSGGKENLAIKLDMNKAYDRLEWHFLENC